MFQHFKQIVTVYLNHVPKELILFHILQILQISPTGTLHNQVLRSQHRIENNLFFMDHKVHVVC